MPRARRRSGEDHAPRWASFDCYGTLIDWESGISAALDRLWPDEPTDALLELYHRLEPQVQSSSPSLPYREVLSRTLAEVAAARGLVLPSDGRDALAASLPWWPAFDDVPSALRTLRERGWRLAILSNVDADLLRSSVRRIGVDPDVRVTVAEAGSYKPAPGHWQAFADRSGADPARYVHVAQSVFHDLVPCASLEVCAVWVNRLGESSEVPRAAEIRTLEDLPDTLDALVPE